MLIRVTGHICEEIDKLLLPVIASLSEKLNGYLIDKFYGAEVKQFTVVLVAVDSDLLLNSKLAEKYNKTGSYKDLLTGEKIKYFSIGLPFDYLVIASMNAFELNNLICNALINRLNDSTISRGRLSKEFNYKNFAADMHIALSAKK
jgi:hypothetical protein